MELPAAEYNEKYEAAYAPYREQVEAIQKDLHPSIDLAFILKHGYQVIKKADLAKHYDESVAEKFDTNVLEYHRKIRDFFCQDSEFKKPYVSQQNDLIQEKRMFCPGYWKESEYGHTDTYYGVKGLVFSKENYKTGDARTCKPSEICRPWNTNAENLDVSALPNVECSEICLFVDDNYVKPLNDVFVKLFNKENFGDLNVQIGCNYYPGEPEPLGSHCDRGYISTAVGVNAEIELYDYERQQWERPMMEDGDLMFFVGQQMQRVFENKSELLLPGLPHRVMEYEEGRISVVINHFYKDLYA